MMMTQSPKSEKPSLLDHLSNERSRRAMSDALIEVMKEVSEEAIRAFQPVICSLMSEAEQEVFEEVNQLAFQEGAWYRPLHNHMVPLCMMFIVEMDQVSRDLVIPAMNHDAGNSLLVIEATSAGADWENVDKRKAHMELGADLCRKQLESLIENGKLAMSDERIEELADIVAHHDDPYLGIDLKDAEHRAHRDADRCFVPCALSFWKDYLAYLNDESYQKKFEQLGLPLTPGNLLSARIASFYESELACPASFSAGSHSFREDLAVVNEGGRAEFQMTQGGRIITEEFLSNRLQEVEEFASLKTVREFREFFIEKCANDFEFLLRLFDR